MSPLNLAACLGQDEFLAQALHRHYKHFPGAVECPTALMSWDALNDILATHRMDPPRFRLSADGEMLPQHRYASPVTTRRHTVWHRLNPAEMHARLAEGASLVLDAVDELHRPVEQAAMEIEACLKTVVQANLYASWTPREGFGTHWDDHDVVVVQVAGRKRWKLYGTTRVAPMHTDTEFPDPPPSEPIAELVLRPGDVLYLPRGWWHSVAASEGEASMHITFGMQTATGAQLLDWLADDLRGPETLRLDMPVHGSPEAKEKYLAHLAGEVASALESPDLIDRYVTQVGASNRTRMRPSLPYITGVPADPQLRVRLATARAELVCRQADGVVSFTATDQQWEMDALAGPLLRRLIDALPESVPLGELANVAGVPVEDAAEVVSALVNGQAATVENTP